ncbi:hypothetical protein EW146_g7952 [Bondarzewia mesenterica]|uniref:Uncharacterized protein n=1 Tax=Bondarzewia mesenterica TaxID=1095465 RepID=A0A4S4LI46_9AGAM|nr:hypothetical protein EW146_g7952 [Bondarzewia mesenterica]
MQLYSPVPLPPVNASGPASSSKQISPTCTKRSRADTNRTEDGNSIPPLKKRRVVKMQYPDERRDQLAAVPDAEVAGPSTEKIRIRGATPRGIARGDSNSDWDAVWRREQHLNLADNAMHDRG